MPTAYRKTAALTRLSFRWILMFLKSDVRQEKVESRGLCFVPSTFRPPCSLCYPLQIIADVIDPCDQRSCSRKPCLLVNHLALLRRRIHEKLARLEWISTKSSSQLNMVTSRFCMSAFMSVLSSNRSTNSERQTDLFLDQVNYSIACAPSFVLSPSH